jgi:hypothetical protein
MALVRLPTAPGSLAKACRAQAGKAKELSVNHFEPIIDCEYCSEFPADDPRFGYHEAGFEINLLDDNGIQFDAFHICAARLAEYVQSANNEGITEMHISKLI